MSNFTKRRSLVLRRITSRAALVFQQRENSQKASSLFYGKISGKCSTKSLHSLGSLSTNYSRPKMKPVVPAQLSVLS